MMQSSTGLHKLCISLKTQYLTLCSLQCVNANEAFLCIDKSIAKFEAFWLGKTTNRENLKAITGMHVYLWNAHKCFQMLRSCSYQWHFKLSTVVCNAEKKPNQCPVASVQSPSSLKVMGNSFITICFTLLRQAAYFAVVTYNLTTLQYYFIFGISCSTVSTQTIPGLY